MLSDQDLLYRIALNHISGVGPVTARNLVSYCGSVEGIFLASGRELLRVPGVGKSTVDAILKGQHMSNAEAELELVHRHGIDVHFYLDDQFPSRLRNIEKAPVLMYSRGSMDLNAVRSVAIVGTRRPSIQGIETCRKIIAGLRQYDPVIVSGLAYGVDITAHREALKYGLQTIGVMGNGFGAIYPFAHRSIAGQMEQNGGLLTEFAFHTKPDRENFPARNRIIAGLSDITVVIESATSGGSMITAEFANALNRDVAAIPGRPVDQRSAGCNLLIKSHKAHLVESAEDIIYLLNWSADDRRPVQSEIFAGLTDPERSVANILDCETGVLQDDLSRRLKMPHGQLASVLLSLEFKGVVRALPGKRYIKTSE